MLIEGGLEFQERIVEWVKRSTSNTCCDFCKTDSGSKNYVFQHGAQFWRGITLDNYINRQGKGTNGSKVSIHQSAKFFIPLTVIMLHMYIILLKATTKKINTKKYIFKTLQIYQMEF